jgi:hypothetical protein
VITLPSWIWPLSWYRRIQDLEAIVVALTVENKKLTNQLAAESISNASIASCYMAALTSMTRDTRVYVSGYATRVAAERDMIRQQAEWDAAYKAAADRIAHSAPESRDA